jgi:hypothetical protein
MQNLYGPGELFQIVNNPDKGCFLKCLGGEEGLYLSHAHKKLSYSPN